tara:strand:+ start:675 stop:983 length:309 start_codon:yes stop_codon:yes gene_type:complete
MINTNKKETMDANRHKDTNKFLQDKDADARVFVRKNRFNGQSIKLTKEEAEKYDAIINNEYAATMEDEDRDDVGISSFWDLVRRDLDWFRKNNAKAYMVLLD